MEIIKLKLADLTPDPKNAKDHPEEQIEQIMRSISEFGNNDPIAVWGPQNIIVEGHGRWEALKRLGHETAECIRLDQLTDEERRAYALVHNQTTLSSGWLEELLKENLEDIHGFDMSAFGFDMEDGEDVIEKADQDDFDPDAEVPQIAERGDIFKLGEHRLICGDSTKAEDIRKLCDGVKIDLLLTDPPYGVDYISKNEFLIASKRAPIKVAKDIQNDGRGSLEDTRDNIWTPAFKNALSVANEACAYYIFSPQGGKMMFLLMQAVQASGWQLKHQLAWVKNSLVLGRADYNYQHEPILYGWGKKHLFYGYHPASVIDDAKPEDLKKLKKDELLDWALAAHRKSSREPTGRRPTSSGSTSPRCRTCIRP